jgi:hypothetical protein
MGLMTMRSECLRRIPRISGLVMQGCLESHWLALRMKGWLCWPLAQGLLGPAPVLASGGALAFKTIFWEEPCAEVDPRKWSVGCFRSRDQLLPIFLVRNFISVLPCTPICKAR